MKIIIIGGGIAGLSAATILSDIPNIEVTIYEKEYQLGGQAASLDSDICNIEYSWRIFGKSYHNLTYILFNKLNLKNNFKNLENNCFINKNKSEDANLGGMNIIYRLLKSMPLSDFYKVTDLLCMDYYRVLNEFDINADEYFKHNEIIHAICGPFLGMEAKKVSIAGIYKNLCSSTDLSNVVEGVTDSMITILPTSEAIFNEWEKYLINKGVIINKRSNVQNIEISNNKISNISINGKMITADEYIFSCSLQFINKLFHKYKSTTFDNMKILENDLQLYFTINMYFSIKIDDIDCKHSVILDAPWQPIIQRKVEWSEKIMKRCNINNTPIKEVWNVGFIDFNPGLYNKKILRDCSLEEAIKEGILQVKNNEYIKNILNKQGIHFDEILLGYEHWYQFIDDDTNKLISKNPKFSINVGTMKRMPQCHNNDIPQNVTLSGYYVNSSMGGVSMEASCETGLVAGKYIIDKYKLLYNDILPIKHNRHYLTPITLPLMTLDKILFNMNISPITTILNSFWLLVIYCIILISIIFYVIYNIILLVKNKMIFK